MVSKAQVMALTAGDSCLEKGANLLLFSPPGVINLARHAIRRASAGPGELYQRIVSALHRKLVGGVI
jgi:hypothetical protein